MSELINIFVRNRIPGILFFIVDDRKVTISSLAKETNITYSHMIKLIRYFSLDRIVSTEKIGRDRIVTLTAKGRKIKRLFREIYGLITPK